MIGMALVMLLTRRKRFLTLLIPGLVWAFAHSSYLTDPIWLRGVELTIATLLLYGLFFLKFGLVATIAAAFWDAQGLRLEKRGYGAALRVTNG